MSFTDILNRLMNETSTSNLALSKVVGVSDTAVGKWRNGISSPSLDNAISIADYFGLNLNELVDIPLKSDIQKFIRIPVIGTVSIWGVYPNKLWTDDYITVDKSDLQGYSQEECYALAVRDDTIPERCPGLAFLIFHQQGQCADGDTVIIQKEGSNEIMFKEFHWCDSSIELRCPNPSYKPIMIKKQNINKLKIHAIVIGEYLAI